MSDTQAHDAEPVRPAGAAVEEVFPGTSELAGLMRGHDWGTTALGPPAGWPRALKTAVGIMLTSQQPIWIGWGNDLIYFYNDPYKSIIGGKHPWAVGRPTREVWSEIWSDIGPMLAQAMGGSIGTYVESQLLIMERNGYPEETYYTFSYSPIRDDSGVPSGIFCANTDDTDRVVGERQLKLLREMAGVTGEARTWQQACERSVQALATADRDVPFALLYVIDSSGDGLSLVGTSGIGPDHPAAPASLTSASPWPFKECLASHRPVLVDLSNREPLPAGAWDRAPTQAVVLPVTASGETGRAGVLVAGLNPYRLYDENYSGFLDLAAGNIAAAIANAEAYEQERRRADALAEIDRAKTTFFSNISHEFRTPLTLMLSPLEDVLAKAANEVVPDNRELVSLAYRNGVRLLKLVNTLLDFSRIEAGRMQASYEAVDLSQLTAELAANFRSVVEKADLKLIVDCPPLPQKVFVDGDMWEKVILNLLSNAFKFTFAGEIEVAVRPAPSGDGTEIVVRDSGTGIASSELPYIFERFRRVEGAQGRSHEGSGIGLALVQELIKLHGGDIRVDSTLGRGTRFTISLPFGTAHLPGERVGAARTQVSTNLRAQAYVDEAMGWLSNVVWDEIPPPSSAADLVPSLPMAAETESILLADDNADMRNYLERLLRAAGFRVDTHPDGVSALESAKRNPPSLVLSDVMMPNLDGFGLLAALRGEPALRDIPVLLLSARAGEEEKIAGLKSGADDYLTKPFSARELIARVQANLQLAGIRRRAREALQEEADALAELHRVNVAIASESNLERMVQIVTDAATRMTGASFGAFFYNVVDEAGEAYQLYTLSGVPRSAFDKFPMPRNTEVFAPTFRGEGIVRSPDITRDPRFGRNPPHYGMPKGHLAVRSYLATPVMGRNGQVAGGLFFGHPDADVFTDRAERLAASVGVMAAIAMEKIRLYEEAQREIAQRRQAESVLRENEQTLERRVAERTMALAESNEKLRQEAAEREKVEIALRQAQKMEAIGQLTGGVAHDFNNLLTVIIGNLESLERQARTERPDPARLLRYADSAMRGARRAAALTQRLLAFSRQQPLTPKPIDLGRLVTGMSELLRRTLGEQIEVETVLAGGIWRAFADPNQVEMAILNLAVNARDAMPQGGKLTIETANVYLDERYAAEQSEVAPGQYTMIAISDTGTGMPPEIIARAFEPFFTTKDVGHGTGLGLSQVYGFVKQSGGHVRIYSEVGMGSTVKLYLPRLYANGETDAEDVAATPAGNAGSEKVLVVEDDEDVRTFTTETLRDLGYRVVEAAEGEGALRILRDDNDIQLLFTDVGLPGGMNGRRLSEAALKIRPGLKVLFTSGYTRNAIVHDGRLDPGVQLIGKPFTQAALAIKLRDILDAQTGPARILAVEDEPLLQALLSDILEEAGFKVDMAPSAAEAISKVQLIPGGVGAAIIDIGLPDRRGDILMRELRALFPAVPVVIATGHDIVDLKAQLDGQPKLAVIQKPYSAEDIVATLAALGLRAPGPS